MQKIADKSLELKEHFADFERGTISKTQFKDTIENTLNIPLTDKFRRILNTEDKNFTSIIRVNN